MPFGSGHFCDGCREVFRGETFIITNDQSVPDQSFLFQVVCRP